MRPASPLGVPTDSKIRINTETDMGLMNGLDYGGEKEGMGRRISGEPEKRISSW